MRTPLREPKLNAEQVLIDLESAHWLRKIGETAEQPLRTKFRNRRDQELPIEEKQGKKRRLKLKRQTNEEKWRAVMGIVEDIESEDNYRE